MDCCNSGTNMNLPYCYVNGEEQEREYNKDGELCTVLKLSGCRMTKQVLTIMISLIVNIKVHLQIHF